MKKTLIATALLFISTAMTHSRVYLGAPFKNGVVLQQNTKAMIWGTATPGSTVTISPSWTTEKTTCVAGADRKWEAELPTPAGSFEKRTITFQDGSSFTTRLTNVLIGEVWLTSGQSNMDMPIPATSWSPAVLNSNKIIASGDNYKGKMHITVIPHATYRYEKDSCQVTWSDMNTNLAKSVSAMSFLFATRLIDSLNVPVGIINSSYGGSSVIAWLPQSTIATFGNIALNDATYANIGIGTAAAIYNDMIKPLGAYTLAGCLWYQGESNAGQTTYAFHLASMVESWRQQFKNPTMPFYQVEISPYAGYSGGKTGTAGAITREQQYLAYRMLPNMGLIGSNDAILTSEEEVIHPSNKEPLGLRATELALHDVYGYKHLKVGYPEVEKITFTGGTARIKFSNCEDGFTEVKTIAGFEIAGSDGTMKSASATIDGNEVVVRSSSVVTPKAVSYCFRNFLKGNLANKAGLPVRPFRSNNSVIPTPLENTDSSVVKLQSLNVFIKQKLANYAAGTQAGYTDPEFYNAFKNTYNEAVNLLKNSPTEATAAPLVEKLRKYSYEIDEHVTPITEGYYYIVSAYSEFKNRQQTEKAMVGTDTNLGWANYDETNAKGIFKLESKDNGKWALYCVGTNNYVGKASGTGSAVPMVDTPTNIQFRTQGRGQWSLFSTGLDVEFNANGNSSGSGISGKITTTAGNRGTASSWYLRKITDEKTLAKILQDGIVAQLTDAITDSKEALEDYQVGTELRDVTQESKDTFSQVIKTASNYDAETITQAEVNKRIETLNKAKTDYINSAKTITPNVWYYIVNQDQGKMNGYSLYLKSPNLVGCDKWTTSADVVVCSKIDAESKDPYSMWRFIPLEQGYAIQNRATGTYLSGTQTKTFHGTTLDEQPFLVNLLAHGQASFTSVDATNKDMLPLYGATAGVANKAGVANSPVAWNAIPVAEPLDKIELTDINNTISIVCLPYAVNNICCETSTIKTYTLTSMPAENTFGLTEQTSFKAGEPFFLLLGNMAEENGDEIKYTLDCPSEYSQEALTVNGLVGVLSKSNHKQTGFTYFNAKNEMKQAGTLSVNIEGQTGYIDPTQVIDTQANIDLLIGEGATGIGHMKVVKEHNGNIYTTDGKFMGSDNLKNLPKGIYIINGEIIKK